MDPVSIILTTVGWIIKPLASKLVGEACERYTKHVGLDQEASSLKNELMNIQLLVETAQSKHLPNEKVHLHCGLKDLKTLVYKARDLLDELDYFRLQKEVEKMNRAEQGTIFSRLSNRLSDLPSSSKAGACKTLKLDKKAMSRKINALVKELQQKYQSVHDALKLEQLGSIALAIQPVTQKVTIDRPQTDAYYTETHIYGRDKERDQIIKLIRDGRPSAEELPNIVAIVGHGGLGKTTLAQLVYNDPGINSSFNFKMWICVSINFDVMGITRQMLEYCPQGDRYKEHSNLNNLKDILKDNLKGKTVLLVLDDIWEIKNQSDWDSLLAPLANKEKSNTVLVTTRFSSIGDMVRTTDPIHLDSLDDSSFWSLFKKSAFGSDQYDVPCELENTGREIVKKLKGNPLAAKTVGAILKGNTDGLHWRRVLENETWKSQEGDGGIMSALKLSYEYLPVHLQQCFSYCSLFPKDYKFEADLMVYMWMAQGYIYEEDVAIEYLNILVERAFFQIHRTSFPDDTLKLSYVMHDLMHDLAQVVSSEECLSICTLYHLEVLRLPSFNKHPCRLPKKFNNLVNLRYLHPDDLHSEIAGVGKLRHLQELKNFKVRDEKGFELEQLAGLKELKILEILTIENVKYRKEAESAKLSEKELVTLKLLWSWRRWSKESNHEHVLSEDILEGLQPNINLRKLHIEYYGGRKSPSWLVNGSLKFLESIKLSNCESWDVLPNFSELVFLKKLSLSSLPKVRELRSQFHGCNSRRGFPSLKLIEVVDIAELETWVWGEQCEVFPVLETLTIKNCPKLKECTFVPFGGQETTCSPHLSCLRIIGCPQLQRKRPIPRTCSTCTSETYHERVVSFEKSEPSPQWRSRPLHLLRLANLEIPRSLDQVLVFKYFRHIKRMDVVGCPNLTCLPWKGICLLDCLEVLTISDCPKLLLSHDEEGDEEKSFLSHNSLLDLEIDTCGVTGEGLSYLLARLPALSTLTIGCCANITLVSVPNRINESDLGRSQTDSLGSLMCLAHLRICLCPNMSFVNKAGLSGLTALRDVRIQGCQNIFSSMTKEEQDDSTGFFPVNLERLNLTHVPDKMSWSQTDLTSLSRLEISDSSGLTFLDLYRFVALRELTLRDCKNLACVRGPNSLVSLESLTVRECPVLVSSWRSASREPDQEFLLTLKSLEIDTVEILSLPACQFLKSLRTLRLELYQGQNSFTEEQEEALLLLTALEELILFQCTHMQSLPRELYRHPSLKELTIYKCPHIHPLPDKGLPKSLTNLRLLECSSELKRECEKLSNIEVTTFWW